MWNLLGREGGGSCEGRSWGNKFSVNINPVSTVQTTNRTPAFAFSEEEKTFHYGRQEGHTVHSWWEERTDRCNSGGDRVSRWVHEFTCCFHMSFTSSCPYVTLRLKVYLCY